jgi:hypothetical protein
MYSNLGIRVELRASGLEVDLDRLDGLYHEAVAKYEIKYPPNKITVRVVPISIRDPIGTGLYCVGSPQSPTYYNCRYGLYIGNGVMELTYELDAFVHEYCHLIGKDDCGHVKCPAGSHEGMDR